MTREEAYEYWRYKYEMAKDFDDPHWEGGEIREIRRYIDALATIVKILEPPTCNADRIRTMSDEELEAYLYNHDFCKEPIKSNGQNWCEGDCQKCVSDWLKSPVEVDNGL